MTLELGEPSERSAVIVRTALPGALEQLRRRSVADAVDGLPAHLTMLYPFVAPARLRPDVRRKLVDVAAALPPFPYRLVGPATWPDTIYVAIDPVEPFLRLQAALQRAFPTFPIYGTDPGFEFVPHATVAEGPPIHEPVSLTDPAWNALPRSALAHSIEVIARPTDAPWRTIWRVPLGRMRA